MQLCSQVTGVLKAVNAALFHTLYCVDCANSNLDAGIAGYVLLQTDC